MLFPSLQFLAQLKLMDYSLLVGIHDVERAEQEEVESEDNEGDDEGESDGGIGTPPDSPSNTLDSTKPLSPGEFDPTIDVYAIKSNDSEWRGAMREEKERDKGGVQKTKKQRVHFKTVGQKYQIDEQYGCSPLVASCNIIKQYTTNTRGALLLL